MKIRSHLLNKTIYSVLPLLTITGVETAVSAAPIIKPPTEPVPTRVLVNPSFEEPAFQNSGATWISLDNYIPGNDSSLQGWFSTHPVNGYSGYGQSRFRDAQGVPYQHLVELWVNDFQGVRAAGGYQFAELNAQANSALYQDIVVFAGESIPWEVSHRGRQKDDIADVAEVFISDPNDWTGSTFSGDKLYSANISTSRNGSISGITLTLGNIANSNSQTALPNGWVRYADIWEGPEISQEYRFAFQAVSTGSGNNTIGNFLDEIQIKLSPIIDIIDPEIESINPYSNSIYYLPVRVNGLLESNSTVEIDVAVAGVDFNDFTLTNLVSGLAQPLGNDFSATKLANGNISLTIPPNLYDPNNPSHYVSLPIDFQGTIVGQDSEVVFTVVNTNGGGGNGVQDLLIPPADAGFSNTQSTILEAGILPD